MRQPLGWHRAGDGSRRLGDDRLPRLTGQTHVAKTKRNQHAPIANGLDTGNLRPTGKTGDRLRHPVSCDRQITLTDAGIGEIAESNEAQFLGARSHLTPPLLHQYFRVVAPTGGSVRASGRQGWQGFDPIAHGSRSLRLSARLPPLPDLKFRTADGVPAAHDKAAKHPAGRARPVLASRAMSSNARMLANDVPAAPPGDCSL